MRVEAPVFVVSCGAVNSAVLLLRSATPQHPRGLANSSGLVGRRYMAHLATMMQGFHPFRREHGGLPEDGRHQRLLPARGRARRTRSARSSRRGARTASWPRWSATPGSRVRHLDSGVGLRRVGGARRRLARDVGGSAARGQPRDARQRTAASGWTTRPTTSRPTSSSCAKRHACCDGSAAGR